MRARNISIALAAGAEQIAMQLLPGGKRAGNYWQAGDVNGEAGSSLYLSLHGDHRGQWRDAATGEHGDLLDLIAAQNNISLADAMIKAEDILGEDFTPAQQSQTAGKPSRASRDNKEAAQALYERARPIASSYAAHAQAYFQARGINLAGIRDLRFHKAVWVDVTNQDDLPAHYPLRPDTGDRRIATLPAIIAAVRNAFGELVAVHRTFLDPIKPIKALIDEPKRALGHLTGGGCWLRRSGACLILAEGIETALSVGNAFPDAPLAAGITAYHLTEMEIPQAYEKVLIAADNDPAGRQAAEALAGRLEDKTVIIIYPKRGDFNDDLRADGLDQLKKWAAGQIAQNKPDQG